MELEVANVLLLTAADLLNLDEAAASFLELELRVRREDI